MTAQTILPANTLSSGYDVDNGIRFDGSSSYMTMTPGSAGSQKIVTFSTWIKRSQLGEGSGPADVFMMYGYAGSSSDTRLYFTGDGDAADDRLYFQSTTSNTTHTALATNRKFRDPNAWYHIVINYNSSVSSPDTNHVEMFINGVKETSFVTETYPSQNDVVYWTDDSLHTIARRSDGGNLWYGGYMAETVMIDGQALDADSFGEFDSDSGIWKPIDVSGLTFGTNGFYLQYKGSGTSANSSGLGADTSGNDHHFAVSGLAATDQTTDTCTNNFATINPLYVGLNANESLLEGNLKGLNTGDGENNYVSTIGVSSGKWYFEAKANVAGNDIATIGIVATDSVLQTNGSWLGSTNDSFFYNENGSIGTNGSASTTGLATYADNDIIGVRVNLDDNELHFYKNGTIITNTALSITANKEYFFGGRVYTNATGWEFNFGSPAYAISSGNADGNGYGNFEYAVPSGYYSLNTKNLAEYG